MEEVTLGANLNIEKLNRLNWKVEDNRIPELVNPEPVNPKPVNPKPVNPKLVNPKPVNPERPERIDNFIVKLTPMQIRTFILDIIPK